MDPEGILRVLYLNTASPSLTRRSDTPPPLTPSLTRRSDALDLERREAELPHSGGLWQQRTLRGEPEVDESLRAGVQGRHHQILKPASEWFEREIHLVSMHGIHCQI